MPIYDYDGTASHQISRLYDAEENSTVIHPISKVYDFDGTTLSLIYSASYEVLTPTVDNTGGFKQHVNQDTDYAVSKNADGRYHAYAGRANGTWWVSNIYTNNKFDFTNYKTLKFRVKPERDYAANKKIECFLDTGSGAAKWFTLYPMGAISSAERMFSFDVSDVSGELAIAFAFQSATDEYLGFSLFEIILE